MVRELTLRYLALALGLPFQVPTGTWGGYTRRPRASTHPCRCPGVRAPSSWGALVRYSYFHRTARRVVSSSISAIFDDENHSVRLFVLLSSLLICSAAHPPSRR